MASSRNIPATRAIKRAPSAPTAIQSPVIAAPLPRRAGSEAGISERR